MSDDVASLLRKGLVFVVGVFGRFGRVRFVEYAVLVGS